jgi:Skp family chaperone for outer membrane proteins
MKILRIAGLMAKRAASGFLDKMNEKGVIDDYSTELKKYQEELEKSTKEFEQAAKEAEEDLKEDAEAIGDTLSE